MEITVQTQIRAPREAIWKTITDIENAPSTIKGIEQVEILEKPENGLVGLKWRETRIMFGKKATEVMWITEAKENEYYKVRAENHGMIYKTTISLKERGDKVEMNMAFGGETQTMMAKFLSEFMGPIVKKTMVKALKKDLQDIKTKMEN